MIVRGIDPGPHESWWHDLDAGDGGPARHVAMGSVEAADVRSLADVDPTRYVIAIEIATGLDVVISVGQAKSTTANLLMTNRNADRVIEACRYRHIRVFEVDEGEARRGIGVRFEKGGRGEGRISVDRQIAIIVPALIRGFPCGRRDSNKGKRDAAVYSLHGAHLLSVEAGRRYDAEEKAAAERRVRDMAFGALPPGTYGPGDYGPDSFGGSDVP